MNKIVLGLLFIVSLSLSPVFAEETEELSPAPPAILDVNYADIEGLGLYNLKNEGSLGRNLWKDTKRSDAVALLKIMPASAKSPAIQRLIDGVLLSVTDAEKIENDVEPVPGEDLLTLRMNKLVESGKHQEAYRLYTMLDQPYHENLAKAGILAMLHGGEKSTACLEGNTVRERFGDSKFWAELSAYCDGIELIDPDADSPLAKAILASQSADKLEETGENIDAVSLLDGDPTLLNAQELLKAYNDIYLANEKIPESWIKTAYNLPAENAENSFYARVLVAAYTQKDQYKPNKEQKAKIYDAISMASVNTQLLLKNIMKIIDSNYKTVDNATNAYEKDIYLTYRQDYVMPSYVVWDRLQNISQTKAFAETVLLNSLLFGNHTLHDIYPLILRDGMRSLEYLDLVNVSRDMALEAALGEF